MNSFFEGHDPNFCTLHKGINKRLSNNSLGILILALCSQMTFDLIN